MIGDEALLCRIADSPLRCEPFPHVIVDDALSSSTYEALCAAIPPRAAFTTNGSLSILPLWKGDAPRPSDHDALWRLTNGIFSQRVADRLVQTFLGAIVQHHAAWFGDAFSSESLLRSVEPWEHCGSVELRDPPNILPPHLDWPNRLISVVFYTPETDQPLRETWGTRLYAVDRSVAMNPLSVVAKRELLPARAIAPDRFTLVEYKPNRLVAFLNTEASVHGAVVDDAAAPRRAFLKGIELTLPYTERFFGLPPELCP